MAFTVRKIKAQDGGYFYGVYDRGSLVTERGTKREAQELARYYTKTEKDLKRKNPVRKLKNGTWIKADKVRLVQKNGRKVLEVKRYVKAPRKKTKRNVAAGFYDEDGYFHPIRASFDYSKKRAGEVKRKRK